MELQRRFFAVMLVFLIASGISYLYFDKIVNWMLEPLGPNNKLVYLTPGGAFSFMIKVSIYMGLLGALPAIVYNIYRFIMPAVQKVKIATAFMYVTISIILAAAGAAFASFYGLPAALKFLTGFNLYHIDPMLTIDSYLTFVMTYLIAGAGLFQIPLVIIIINSVTPLKPLKMLSKVPEIIVASLVVAAIISPTPDIMNQLLFAGPMVVMYTSSIIIVAIRNHGRSKKQAIAEDIPQGAFYLDAQPPSQSPLVVPEHFFADDDHEPLFDLVPQKRTAPEVATQIKPATLHGKPVRRLVDGFGPKPGSVKPTAKPIAAPAKMQPAYINKQVAAKATKKDMMLRPVAQPHAFKPATRSADMLHVPVRAQIGPSPFQTRNVPVRSVDGFMTAAARTA